MAVTLLHGDALEVLRTLPDCSVDAIVTDPPAGISFMSAKWDTDHGGRDNWIAAFAEIARECLRVVKPGAHALVWALPRTSHWTATAWEDGGWEVRDRVSHVFGSGFPKSHDVSKAIDKAAGAEREVIGMKRHARDGDVSHQAWTKNGTSAGADYATTPKTLGVGMETAPATDDAKRWQGWGSALKPAMEDWWLLRKPLTGTIAANVMQWGTGAINIDKCRVNWQPEDLDPKTNRSITPNAGLSQDDYALEGEFLEDFSVKRKPFVDRMSPAGRWPAHLIHDGSDEVVAMFPQTKAGYTLGGGTTPIYGSGQGITMNPSSTMDTGIARGYGDTGSAARFFYCAKSSKRDRDEGLPEGMRNGHPTVKATELCRYLCRLITPAGGVVLDPFCGSGSTGKGAVLEGFNFIGIDQSLDYIDIARARIAWAEAQVRQLELGVQE